MARIWKQMKTVVLLLLLLVITVSSCDLFFTYARGRVSKSDERAQLSAPRLASLSAETALFQLSWKDPLRWQDGEETLEEVLCIWSDTSFVLSMTDPRRLLSSYEEERYSSPGTYTREIGGFSDGDTIYLTVFAKNQRNGWMRMFFRSCKTSALAAVQNLPGISYDSSKSYEVDTTAFTIVTPPASPYSLTGVNYILLSLPSTVPENAVILRADLELATAYDGLGVQAVPLVRPFDGGDYSPLMEEGLLSYASSSEAVGSGGATLLTVSRAIAAAYNSGEDSVLLKLTVSGTVNLTLSSLALAIDYIIP